MVPLLLSPRSSLSLPCTKKNGTFIHPVRNLNSHVVSASQGTRQSGGSLGKAKGYQTFLLCLQPLAIFQNTPMKPFLWLKYQKKKLLCSAVQTHTSALTVPTKPQDKCINHIHFILGKSKITNRQ